MLKTPNKPPKRRSGGEISTKNSTEPKRRRRCEKPSDDPRVFDAAELLATKGPLQKLTTAEAVKASGHTDDEVKDNKHRNRAERCRDKLKKDCNTVPRDVSTTDGGSFLSPITMPTGLSSVAEVTVESAPTVPTASLHDNSNLKPSKPKMMKANSVQALKLKRREKARERHETKAFKICCLRFKDHQDQKAAGVKNTKSAETVCDEVSALMRTLAAPRTVRRFVAQNKAGESPLPMGPSLNQGLDDGAFAVLLRAFESCFRINQCDGESFLNQRPALMATLNAVVEPVWPADGPNLLRRCLNDTMTDTKALMDDCREERRVRWTTHSNPKCWSAHWRKDLAELGFGSEGPNGFDVPEAQLRRIINLDETALCLDGGVGGRGGQPAVTFTDPSLPNPGTPTTKSGACITMITGSSACGEPLPPHCQFPCRTKDDSRKKLESELTDHLHDAVAAFGHRDENGNHKERPWACTLGMNEKGGMDLEQFELHMNNSIVPLCPDAADVKGLRVMVKLDLGPGRVNYEMPAALRHRGFHVCPSAPNTTHVTQETDRSFGLFKSIFHQNPKKLAKDRYSTKTSVSLAPHLTGLLVHGGTDPVSGCKGHRNAFGEGFTQEKNRNAWAKVGAALLTEACLTDKHVRRELGDGIDAMAGMHEQTQKDNDIACTVLLSRGLRGNELRAQLKPKVLPSAVTVPNSDERMEALANGRPNDICTHTGGTHITSDESLRSGELRRRKAKAKAIQATKRERVKLGEVFDEAIPIIESERTERINDLKGKELKTLLKFHGLKPCETGRAVQEQREQCRDIKARNVPPAEFTRWTAADDKLVADLLDPKKVQTGDTLCGRRIATEKARLRSTLLQASREELKSVLEDRERTLAEAAGDSGGVPDEVDAAAETDAETDPSVPAQISRKSFENHSNSQLKMGKQVSRLFLIDSVQLIGL